MKSPVPPASEQAERARGLIGEELREQMPEPSIEISDRVRFRDLLRRVWEKVVVNTVKREMVVHFRNGRKPLGISIWATA